MKLPGKFPGNFQRKFHGNFQGKFPWKLSMYSEGGESILIDQVGGSFFINDVCVGGGGVLFNGLWIGFCHSWPKKKNCQKWPSEILLAVGSLLKKIIFF